MARNDNKPENNAPGNQTPGQENQVNGAAENTVPAMSEEDRAALKAELMAELRASMAEEAAQDLKRVTERNEKKTNPYLEELVDVTLFKDGQKYKDDVFVSINDEPPIAIKRGVPVKIKRKYALVLEASLKQDVVSASFSEEKKEEYRRALVEYHM